MAPRHEFTWYTLPRHGRMPKGHRKPLFIAVRGNHCFGKRVIVALGCTNGSKLGLRQTQMALTIFALFFWISGCTTAVRGNKVISSFSQAKKHVYALHEGQPRTLYCDCAHQNRQIQFEGCAFQPDAEKERDLRTEIEHIVPMKRFRNHFDSWVRGHPKCIDSRGKAFKGRRCARKVSTDFRFIEADLYNLYPAIGSLNQHRGAKTFGEVPGEPRRFGACDFEVAEFVEPRPEVRGDIARAYLYMAWAYPNAITLTAAERTQYERWSRHDPPGLLERRRAHQIRFLQKNPNPFIELGCQWRYGLVYGGQSCHHFRTAER